MTPPRPTVARKQPTQPYLKMLTLYHVITTAGLIPVHARTRDIAIRSALELAGRGAKLINTTKPGEW